MGCKFSKSKAPITLESYSNTYTEPIKPTVCQMLHDKSKEIIPDHGYYRIGNATATNVCNIVGNVRKDVDRLIITGSNGKRTAVSNVPDFEFVIFLNRNPPFSSVLKKIKKILGNHRRELESYKFISKSAMSISFEVSGLRFELFPATNFKGNDQSQFKGNRDAIERLTSPLTLGYFYSPGFGESTVEFLKSKSPFIHQIVRLAKYWNSNLKVGCYIRGRSLIMELIAIKSCEEIDNVSLYMAFKKFLENINNFSNLVIFFEYFYDKEHIPRGIMEYDGPIVMDPVNFYNNMTKEETFPTSAVLIFIIAAGISLQRLEDWIKDPHADTKSFDEIFEPDS